MVARLHRGDALSHLPDDAGTLVAEDRRENSLAVEAIKRIGVGVANSRRLDLDKDFARFGTLQIELDDFERLLGLECDSGACLHLPFLHSRFFSFKNYFC